MEGGRRYMPSMQSPAATRRNARSLRRQMTPPELIVWQALRGRALDGRHFRRQHPIGPYVLDFYCARAKLALEVDGLHHATDERQERDQIRDAWLERRGVTVFRLTAGDVMGDLDGAMMALAARLEALEAERRR
ncbi:MAG TPA: endonuclease domain-containing protein [Caulobacteraceae bacterium]|nr:endonuclease domain-containing protein [Caulobacteraceae bacterium]